MPRRAADSSDRVPATVVDHDVVIVGAGISGISAAYHLTKHCPSHTFTILEARSDIGGTWDLFRYPGVRSDSDMHTLGFGFKPWMHDKSIADGPSILAYLRETASEQGIEDHIRLDHHVRSASWSSDRARWELTVDTPVGVVCHRTNVLFMCSGYYSYKGGYTPDLAGREEFRGTIVHPQVWPDDLDTEGKRIIVIGSGATAVTLVPALAEDAAHVTMLQRSPTYVVAQPDVDRAANQLRRLLPSRLAHAITRRKNIARDQWLYKTTRTAPQRVRSELLRRVTLALGPDLTEEHFTPTYDPWDQRLCVVPNGDLFESITSGAATVVTDTIDHLDAAGIVLSSGAHLPADIIVTATGLRLVTVGEMDVLVDGEPIDFSATWTYRGVGYSGIPNFVSTFGYINASWTLRADLVSRYVCRVLSHMRATGANVFTPTLRDGEATMQPRPWIDDFTSGYMRRGLPELPKQGDHEPWTNPQRYAMDRTSLLRRPIEDGWLRFRRVAAASDDWTTLSP